MGVYYVPKAKKKSVAKGPHSDPDGTFLVNYSGADMLGLIHAAAGASLSQASGFSARPEYETTDKQCKEDSQKILGMPAEKIAKLYKEVNNRLFNGTLDEFTTCVREWAAFLATCQGYEAS